MFCRNCGKEIQAGDKFCMTCGWRVPAEGETQPTEAQTAEVKPAETQPTEAQTAEVKPAETQPTEAQTAEVKPAETQPTEAQSPEIKPAETQPAEAQSPEIKPAETQSAEAQTAGVQPAQQSAAAVPQAADPVAPTKQEKPKKKKKKGFFIAIGSVAVLAVAVIAAAFNWNSINNFMMRTFSSPDKYYQYIEQENVNATIATAASAYNVLMLEPLSSVSEKYQSYLDGSLQGEDISFSGEVTLTLGELAQEMIKIAYPDTSELGIIDSIYNSINSISAYYEISRSGDLMQMLVGLGLQDNRILSVDYVIDDGDDIFYVGFPELSQKYLSMKLADVIPEWDDYQNFAKNNLQDATEYLQILEKIAAKLPDEKQARTMMEKYGKIIIGCLSDVDKKNGVNLKAGGVSQKCTRLDVTIDGKTLAKIAKKVCGELKDDKEFKKIFIGVLEELTDVLEILELDDYLYYAYGTLDIDAEKIYEAFRSGCKILADNADVLKDLEFELVMSVYVDSKGQISGRSFEIEYNGVKMEMLIANPQDGKETGYKVETVVTMNGESGGAVMEGSYKESGGKLNGKFTMTVNAEDEEMDLWQLTVKQLDKAGLDKGYINGSFSMKLSEDLLREIAPGYLVSKLAAMELCLDMSSGEDASKCEFKLLEDGGLWASLVMSGKTEKGKKISAPSDLIQIKDISDEDKYFEDLKKYWNSIDWKTFKKNLEEAGLPENLLSVVDVLANCSFEEILWMFLLTKW